jgi:hypothetical protein
MKPLILLTIGMLALSGCGGAPPPVAESPPVEHLAATALGRRPVLAERALETEAVGTKPGTGADNRAIISSAELRLETGNPDSVHALTIEYAYTHGGYVLLSESGRTSIRIPAQHFHAALEELATFGLLVDKSVKSDEVTDQFYDLQTRLANAEKTRERYLKLMDRATSIPEILKLERELERINQMIETYKGKLGRLSHLTLHSTITVSTKERTRLGPVGFAVGQVFKGLKWLFVRD